MAVSSDPDITNQAMLSTIAGRWIEDYTEKKYHAGRFSWTKDVARSFAKTSIEDLLFDPYFLNAKKWLYPGIADIIIDIYEERKKRPITLVAVLGGIGSGKTSGLGACLNWLEWFRFSCKFDENSHRACPQEYYDLKPTSKVVFIALSKTVEKSKQITFSEMISAFQSGFNKDYFPINERKKSVIDIPGNNTMVFPNTATEAANAGYNVYSFVMDEVSFLEIVDSSSRARGTGGQTYDQAEAAYNSAEQRRISRFRKRDFDDGLGVLISSVNYDEDYLVSRIRKAYSGIDDKGVYYKVLIPWEVDPKKDKNKGYFYFDTNNYKIIEDERIIEAMDKYYVDVPIEDIIFGNTDNDPNDKLLREIGLT